MLQLQYVSCTFFFIFLAMVIVHRFNSDQISMHALFLARVSCACTCNFDKEMNY